ncbi:hypothetical protein YC2023_028367 [Brassica napus]
MGDVRLRFMILAGDIPLGLVSFGSTFATFSSIYIALARASAVEEKLIVIFILMNMDVAGYDFPFMKMILSSETMEIPDGVAKVIEVESPRSKLTHDCKHINFDFHLIKDTVIGKRELKIDSWFG